MRMQLALYSALIAVLLAGSVAEGGEFATAQEAKAMLYRAITELKADKRAAIDKFNHNEPRFRDRDLFVFCFNANDGTFTAHEAMVAHDVRRLRGADGEPFGEKIFASAREAQIRQITYVWPFPGSTHNAVKDAYVMRAGDQVCGVSAYRETAPAHAN